MVSRKIKGAAIDVFSEEPPTDNLLIKLDNVVATPHMAAHEETTLRKMDTKSIEIIASVCYAPMPDETMCRQRKC